ncbi:MAG: hypothetical protein ABGW84_07565 [Sphingomonadaceae bacterium]
MAAFINCVKGCLATYFANLGPFAIAAIVLCIIAGGVATPAAAVGCLAAAGVGAVAIGFTACVACC